MAITICHVAREAGVSTATVSHVLNGTGQVSHRTRRLVRVAVKRLGYVPNAHARNLASRRSRTFGIIVSDIENPFFPEVIKGFEARARQRGYEVILSDTNYDPRLMKAAVGRMLEQKVRGVAIVTSEMSRKLIEEIIRRRIPVAFLDLGPVQNYVCNIKMDYYSGIRQVVDHLCQLGHREIAFAGGRPELQSNMARQNAFVECMRTQGLEPASIQPGNLRFDGGLAAAEALMKLSPLPTAVVAVNDLTAVGVIKGLSRSGLRIPQDISVTGFDRIHLAEYVVPSLTTVDLHRDLVGITAADALHQLSSSSEPSGREYRIPVEMVVGESTGPARILRPSLIPSAH
jgi:LacI family transcriptional regulator